MRELTIGLSIALVLGAGAAAVGWVWLAVVDPGRTGATPAWVPLNVALVLGGLLTAVGLAAIPLHLADDAGWTGVVGTVLLSFGLAVAYGAVHTADTLGGGMVGPIRWFPMLAVPAFIVGGLLIAWAGWRSGSVPGIVPLVVVLGGLLTISFRLVETPDWFETGSSAVTMAGLSAWGIWILLDP